MRIAFAVVLALHGAIHLMGFAKAFGLAELPQLIQPISRPLGLCWLLAALLTLASAAAVLAWPGGWWWLGAAALLVSQLVIATAWHDARWGTLANVLLLAGVALGAASHGPWSLRAEYRREAASLVARRGPAPTITEADLARLPDPVRRYLRLTGALGQERVRNFRAAFRGFLRSGPSARWMDVQAEQYESFDEPTRLFFLDASLLGVPLVAYHRYRGPSATMRVKLLSAFTMVDARGPEMDRAETVTLFNDMCLLAPASLVDPAIRWEPVDARTVRATFGNAGQTIRAELFFDEEGYLVDFASDDRARASPDGKSFEPARWTTPVAEYRAYGRQRLWSRGEARWRDQGGEFAYARLELVDVAYNVAR
jgi:hypothetical protein